MERKDILERVQTVFREELEDETIVLTENSTAKDRRETAADAV